MIYVSRQAQVFGERLAMIAVVVIVLAVFLPTLGNDYVYWDDDQNLLSNLHYRGLGWEQLRWMSTAVVLGHWMPLTWLSYGIDYTLYGTHAWGYHLTSVLIHAINAALVLLIARQLGLSSSAAVVASLLWGLHPLRVESVAWLTERRDVLCGFFYLLTVLLYLRGRLAWAFAAFVCALMSKSLAVSAPIVLAILDRYRTSALTGEVIGGDARSRGFDPRRRLHLVPFVAASAVASVIAIMVLPKSVMLTTQQMSLWERLGVAVYGLGFYAAKTVVPLHLSPLYELPKDLGPLVPAMLLAALGLTTLCATAWVLRQKYPALLAVSIVSLAILAPVIGILQNGPQIAADRYTYLASVGWMLLAGRAVEMA